MLKVIVSNIAQRNTFIFLPPYDLWALSKISAE